MNYRKLRELRESEGYRSNNVIGVEGVIVSGYRQKRRKFGEAFYEFDLEVERGWDDKENTLVHIIVTEDIADIAWNPAGCKVRVTGTLEHYKDRDMEGPEISIRAVEIVEIKYIKNRNNSGYLEGTLQKDVKLRKTSKGRDIADIVLRVENKTDSPFYFWLVAFGKAAKAMEGMEAGDRLEAYGRLDRKIRNKGTEREREVFEFVIDRIAYGKREKEEAWQE